MKSLLLFLVSLLFPVLLHAQKVSWNRARRLKNDSSQLFIGQKDSNMYFILHNRLIKYSSDYNHIEKIKLKGMYGFVHTAFILKNEIIVIRKEEIPGIIPTTMITRIAAMRYNFEGKQTQKEVTLVSQTDNQWNVLGNRDKGFWDCREGFDAHFRLEITVSDNSEYIGVHAVSNAASTNRSDEFLIYKASDFKKVCGSSFKAEDKLQCFALNNGGFLTLQGDDIFMEDCPKVLDPITLTSYDSTGAVKNKLVLPLKPNKHEFRNGLFYKLDERQNAIYVLINFAVYTPEECNVNASRHETSTIRLEKISLDDFKPVLSKSISINEKTIEQTGVKMLLGNAPKGVNYLQVIDVLENNDDIFVFAQLKYCNVNAYTTTGDVKFRDQIIFKESLTGNVAVQKVNKTKYQTVYPGYGIIFRNKDVYIIYNRVRIWKTNLNIVKLDENLEEKNKISVAPKRFWQKIFLKPYPFYGPSENKYVLFGNFKNRLGSAIVELE